MHRRLETCGKPFVALINGHALGGGYELCLACHHRIMTDDPKATVGLPEVTVGLLPGSGGTQRLPRMIGLEASLPILLEGRTLNPQAALKLGMVDQVVPAAQMLEAARTWLLGRPDAVREWDRKGYKPSNGLLNGATALTMSMRASIIGAQTQHNYPAPITILRCLFEGAMLPFERALRLESKYFAQLFAHPVARNIIRTQFVNKAEAGKLARRPPGFRHPAGSPTRRPRRRNDGRGNRIRCSRRRHRCRVAGQIAGRCGKRQVALCHRVGQRKYSGDDVPANRPIRSWAGFKPRPTTPP